MHQIYIYNDGYEVIIMSVMGRVEEMHLKGMHEAAAYVAVCNAGLKHHDQEPFVVGSVKVSLSRRGNTI